MLSNYKIYNTYILNMLINGNWSPGNNVNRFMALMKTTI